MTNHIYHHLLFLYVIVVKRKIQIRWKIVDIFNHMQYFHNLKDRLIIV